MANRSDVFKAKLPRVMKRYLLNGKFDSQHEYGDIKRLMISAHASYVRGKTRRVDVPVEEPTV
jgi:hypothetical protein